MYACDDPKKRRCRAKIIGSAMATLTGVFMFFSLGSFGYDCHFERQGDSGSRVLLMVLPLAGLILSIIGIRLKKTAVLHLSPA
ncbi:hypothetical protein JCM18916_3870 [Cutibacterium acnes JCM 18916]|nr:hypothetical protein JCM18916_3870 [Cutibacterium acnes JCM 18916]